MWLYTTYMIIGILAALVTTSPTPRALDEVDALANNALANLISYERSHGDSNKTCTLQNAAVRREWGSLSLIERKKYTDAMLCLMSKPPKLVSKDAPGIRSRFDDFVSVHIRQTPTIHATGNFLTWHRYYTWAFEQALRNECRYDGYQPYWAWNKYAHDPINSPLFDGSDYSLSGNGEYASHNATPVAPITNVPPGRGGGCVTTGPFRNMSVNLGPVAPTLKIPGLKPQPGNGLDYNPRCLRRDISSYVSMRWTKTSDITDLIKNYTGIGPFQDTMQGNLTSGDIGVHGGGHYIIGGDPGGDFYASPSEPAFYVHHAMVDRVFWIWQNHDPETRRHAVGGTLTMLNDPPSRNTTLDDLVDLGGLLEPYRLVDLLDTTGGPFCYIYA